jgi:hypothetical protein
LTHSYIMYTFGTNTKFEADEFNFFKERRDLGVRKQFRLETTGHLSAV